MPDIGWMELMVIGIVALIVVGPKDLPKLFLKLGQMTGRVRAMAKDFSNAMNEAAGEAGMTDLNRDLRKAGKFTNPRAMAKDLMGDVMEDIDPTKFEEGSATRIIAEKHAAARVATREKAEALRAARAAELSDEPEEEGLEGAATARANAAPAKAKPAAAKAAETATDTAKPAAKKTAAKKPAAKKPAARKAGPKKAAARKPAATSANGKAAARRAPGGERADPGPANIEAPADTGAAPEPQADRK